MTEGRRECDGLLTAWHFAAVAGVFGGKLDPNEINPFKIPVPQSDAMRELLAWRRKRAFKGFAADVARVAKRRG